MDSRKKFIKFIKPSPKAYIWGIALIIVGAAALGLCMFDGDMQLGIIMFCIALVMGLILIAFGVMQSSKFKKYIAEVDKKEDMPDILDDFETGKVIFDGALIVGRYFLISKRSGAAVEYSEIEKLYQLVKGGGSSSKRIIQIKTVDKKKLTLCRIPLHGSKYSEELGKLLGLITARNKNLSL